MLQGNIIACLSHLDNLQTRNDVQVLIGQITPDERPFGDIVCILLSSAQPDRPSIASRRDGKGAAPGLGRRHGRFQATEQQRPPDLGRLRRPSQASLCFPPPRSPSSTLLICHQQRDHLQYSWCC